MAIEEIRVPDIGDFKDVEVIEVLAKPGDRIAAEAGLLVLESDKATMEVPTPSAGVVKEIKVKVGDRVSQGTVIAALETEGGAAAAAAPAAAPAPAVAAPAPAVAAPAPAVAAPAPAPAATAPAPAAPLQAPPAAARNAEVDEAAFHSAHASPAIRRFARELGIDLGRVKGTGPKGRIQKEDLQAFVKQLASAPAARGGGGGPGFDLPPLPPIDFAKFGPVETRALSRIKKLSGANLHRNWISIPHITQNDEADITDLEAFRKSQTEAAAKRGIKLTPLAFMIKAVVTVLKDHPEFNSSLEAGGANLILKRYYNIGVAVDTPDGLVVPVVRDADRKGVLELARELGEISQRARDKKLAPGDMQGGTFSISSLGGIGGTTFTPIINAPEVAILGVGRSVMRPVWHDNAFAPRLILPLSLSYDHRVIDGAAGARFITAINAALSDIRRLVL